MKRMAKGRGDYLRKGRTQCAGRICGRARLHSQLDAIGAGDMADLVNHGTLLRRHQQQQKP
jgi:hypothetical protein